MIEICNGRHDAVVLRGTKKALLCWRAESKLMSYRRTVIHTKEQCIRGNYMCYNRVTIALIYISEEHIWL